VVRVLWADAICINQNDLPERSQQVSIMRKIFKQAERVLSWLGRAADGNDLAFDFCNALQEGTAEDFLNMQTGGQSIKDSSVICTSNSAEEAAGAIPDSGDASSRLFGPLFWKRLEEDRVRENQEAKNQNLAKELYHALIMLQKRSYWERIWIIPEVALGKEVILHCGDRRMPFEANHQALEFLRKRLLRRPLRAESEESLEKVLDSFSWLLFYRSENPNWSLPDLLEMFGSLNAVRRVTEYMPSLAQTRTSEKIGLWCLITAVLSRSYCLMSCGSLHRCLLSTHRLGSAHISKKFSILRLSSAFHGRFRIMIQMIDYLKD
jgi:hypothetical protein